MLPKESRLIKNKDFENVYKNGVAARAGHLLIKTIQNDLSTTRIGVVVGKKVSNKAVDRNKIKRRLKALFRQNLSQIKPGYDLVVIPNKSIQNDTFQEIEQAFHQVLQKINLL